MGVRSTYTITREVAQQILLQNIMKLNNRQLGSMLYELPQCTYMNFDVVDTASDVFASEDNEYRRIVDHEQFKRLSFKED